jgi:hypothetical protein
MRGLGMKRIAVLIIGILAIADYLASLVVEYWAMSQVDATSMMQPVTPLAIALMKWCIGSLLVSGIALVFAYIDALFLGLKFATIDIAVGILELVLLTGWFGSQLSPTVEAGAEVFVAYLSNHQAVFAEGAIASIMLLLLVRLSHSDRGDRGLAHS